MDPQGRVLLEQTGLALQDAKGRQLADVEPSTGVYVGVMHMEFIQHLAGKLLGIAYCCICRPCTELLSLCMHEKLHPVQEQVELTSSFCVQGWGCRWGPMCPQATAWTSWQGA